MVNVCAAGGGTEQMNRWIEKELCESSIVPEKALK
jgi:hypothetical protein